MNSLLLRRFIIIIVALSALAPLSEAQPSRSAGHGLFGRSGNNKSGIKVKRPRNPRNAIKMQEKKEKKLKKDYVLFIKNSRKRSVAIQTPEVQSRMIQNQKNSESNYKIKRKKMATGTQKAGRKYKK